MKIAVLSGKGGTGKTLLSVNLASVAGNATYVDCDVEEPNGHLFFKPENVTEENVSVKIPKIDSMLCSGCRKCVDFCKFNALAFIKKQVYVFEDICHSCGGCMMVCPEGAISEVDKPVGKIRKGTSQDVTVETGMLDMGQASGVPIIEKLLKNNRESDSEVTMIDCPPGSACVVMESIKDADYCILVAEPTIFGVHNLNMVYELVKVFGKPFGVVLNKCLPGESIAENFCKSNDIKVLGRIPFDSELGKLNSDAHIAARENRTFNMVFSNILNAVKKEVQHETVACAQR